MNDLLIGMLYVLVGVVGLTYGIRNLKAINEEQSRLQELRETLKELSDRDV